MVQPVVQEQKSGRSSASSAKGSPKAGATRKGLTYRRFYTTAGVHPFDTVEWELRDAVITNEKGERVFEQKGVELPRFWSQTATNVVVSKYFRGQLGTPGRERSVRQLLSRLTRPRALPR